MQEVAATLRETGLVASSLVLEITETVLNSCLSPSRCLKARPPCQQKRAPGQI